jgi:DNA-binding winged helix-turn-helix (wHTH) protein
LGESQPVSYRFGNFRVVPTDKRLFRDGRPVPLAPKLFDTLLLLVESGGRLLEKQEFLTRVWKDSMVEEVAIAHAISHLRKVLRNGSNASNVIETVSKRGYRFTASVETIGAELPGTSHVILAVLPFESFGASSDLEYLADGLTEEVIAALGQIEPKHISVIGRTTMMAYKRTTKSLSDIGRELGAAFLVESSVRAEDARLRITSKLIRAREQVQNLGGIV